MGTVSAEFVPEPCPQVPESDQVVSVRRSTWAVARVQEQQLPRSSADEAQPGLNHVVTLPEFTIINTAPTTVICCVNQH